MGSFANSHFFKGSAHILAPDSLKGTGCSKTRIDSDVRQNTIRVVP